MLKSESQGICCANVLSIDDTIKEINGDVLNLSKGYQGFVRACNQDTHSPIMASYLITGSSRGIGLAYVAVLAGKDASEVGKIFAAARSESFALKQLIAQHTGVIEFVPLEVTSEASAKEAAQRVERSLGDKGLDVLINNAGIPSHHGGVENMYVTRQGCILITITDHLLGQT